jgi:hypothetical protein
VNDKSIDKDKKEKKNPDDVIIHVLNELLIKNNISMAQLLRKNNMDYGNISFNDV